jgi:HD-GYP domain-containing protein (c-di-GMP phosphodiesterase class II)
MKMIDKNSCVLNSSLSHLQKALYERTPETSEHCNRIEELGSVLGNKLGLGDKEMDELFLLAHLHDIGKITVPKCILEKPGRLDKEEWVTMQSHSYAGYKITSSYSEFEGISRYILSHHERWDGKGYPLGLKREQIPFLSRVISVVDSYDAMIDTRPYKKPLTKEEAIKELQDNAGTQFDPYITREFIKLLEKR